MLEKKIQAKILKYLRLIYPKAVVWKLADTKINGIPDILFISDGEVIFFEIKTQYGRLMPMQEYTIRKLNESGVKAYLVRTLDDVKGIL